MGTLPVAGAKMVLIKVDPGAAVDPVVVRVNGSVTGGLELAAGGLLLVSNPAPAAGITALSIVYATTCIVRVWVLG